MFGSKVRVLKFNKIKWCYVWYRFTAGLSDWHVKKAGEGIIIPQSFTPVFYVASFYVALHSLRGERNALVTLSDLLSSMVANFSRLFFFFALVLV